MARTVRLTKLERATAIAEARAAGVQWNDEVVVEMAEEDKRRALAEVEKSEVAKLRARVAALEKVLGKDGQRIFDAVAHAVGQTLPKYLDREFARRLVLRDRGVWDMSREYQPGELVSCNGSGWVCKAPTRERPGSDPTSWRLAIKKGRDAT